MKFKLRDIVWVCVPGYPWWPGKIVSPDDEDISDEVLRSREKNDIIVKFYQSNDFYWLNSTTDADSIKLFTRDNNPNTKDKMADRNLVRAIKEAIEDLGEPQEDEQKQSAREGNAKSNGKGAKREFSDNASPLKKRKKRDHDETFENKGIEDNNPEEYDSEEDNRPAKKKIKTTSIPKKVKTPPVKKEAPTKKEEKTSSSKKEAKKEEEKKITPVKPVKKLEKGEKIEKAEKTESATEKTPAKKSITPVKKESSQKNEKKPVETKKTEKQKSSINAPKGPTDLSNDELRKCNEALMKAIEEKNDTNIERYLKFLDKDTIIKVQQLTEVKIGKTVHKLRKHENPAIAQLSSNLVQKWKAMVDKEYNADANNNDSAKAPVKEANEQSKSVKPVASAQKKTIKPVQVSPPPPISPHDTKEAETKPPTAKDNQESNDVPTSPASSTSASARITEALFSETDVEMKLSSTGDKNRDWTRKKLALGLLTGTDDLEKAIQLAVEIEDALLSHFNSYDNYKTQLRPIRLNLADRNNKDFCDLVLKGEYTPKQLCTMDSIEMASKETQERRKRLMEEKKAERMTFEPTAVKSSLYRCGKCKKKECSYYQMQTRSADEPMTTFVTCHNCGNRWKC